MSSKRILLLAGGCLLAAAGSRADDLGYVDCSNHSDDTPVFSKARKSPDQVAAVACGERFTVLLNGFIFSRIETKDGKIGYIYSNYISVDRGATAGSVRQPDTGKVVEATSKVAIPSDKPAQPKPAQVRPTFPQPASVQPPAQQTVAATAPATPDTAPATATPVVSTAPATNSSATQSTSDAPLQAQPAATQPAPASTGAVTSSPSTAAPATSTPAPSTATDSPAADSASPSTATPTSPSAPEPPAASAPETPVKAEEAQPAPAPQPQPAAAQPQPADPNALAPAIRDARVRESWEKPNPGARKPFAIELFGGFTYTRFVSGGYGSNFTGATGSVGWNFKPWLQIIGDSTYSYATISGTKNALYGNHYGPRYYFRRLNRWNITPFVEGLVGGTRADTTVSGAGGYTTSANCISYKVGGGVDMHTSKHLEIRVFDVDYYRTAFGSNLHQSNYTVSTGIVLQLFGGRE